MAVSLLRRVLATVPVMGVVALFVFALLHLAPGDPAALIAGDLATANDVERIREKLGLNAPLHIQFVTWIGQLLRGDLGVSIFSSVPVTKLIRQRAEPTAALTIATLVLAISLAVPMGVLAAWKAGSWIDQVIM